EDPASALASPVVAVLDLRRDEPASAPVQPPRDPTPPDLGAGDFGASGPRGARGAGLRADLCPVPGPDGRAGHGGTDLHAGADHCGRCLAAAGGPPLLPGPGLDACGRPGL